jgi:hypothetical protein
MGVSESQASLGEPMHVPGLMERVHLGGFDEVYLVTRVDDAGQVADMLPLIYGLRPLLSVPFLLVESIPGCGPPPLRLVSWDSP